MLEKVLRLAEQLKDCADPEDKTFHDSAAAIRALVEVVDNAKRCVGPDPIYGWDEPRSANDDEPCWADLARSLAKLQALNNGLEV